MKEYINDKRMIHHDTIDDLEFASILVSLEKTKMPFYQQLQIILQLYDKFYLNWEKKGVKK